MKRRRLETSISRAKRAETVEDYHLVLHDIAERALNAVDKNWALDAICKIAQAARLKT